MTNEKPRSKAEGLAQIEAMQPPSRNWDWR